MSGDVPGWPFQSYNVAFDIQEGVTDYFVTFFVQEQVKTSYNVAYRVSAGRIYDVTFQVRDVVRAVTRYDQVTFNVQDDTRTIRRYEVVFSALPGITAYDVEFNVLLPPAAYDVSFSVAAGAEMLEYDVYAEVIESWIPVTLRVTTNPSFPGNIPPSQNKHRLNIRVFFGDIMGGAGVAAYLWTGPNDGRVQIIVEDIPEELGAEMRVVVYNNACVVIDSTEISKPVWEGYFNGTA